MTPYPDLDQCLDTLADDGLILMPTLSTWHIACDSSNPVALQRMKKIRQWANPHTDAELLVSSMDMLKRIVPDLHPRLETLLVYHQRPLTILCREHADLPAELLQANGSIALRLVKSPYCTELIQRLARPLFAAYALADETQDNPSFGAIRSDVVSRVDYVCRYGRDLPTSGPPVMVTMGESEELEFLRE